MAMEDAAAAVKGLIPEDYFEQIQNEEVPSHLAYHWGVLAGLASRLQAMGRKVRQS
jgi:hypothetical protein